MLGIPDEKLAPQVAGLLLTDDGAIATAAFLARHDIVVNCVLQDTGAPLMFATNDDLLFPSSRS